MKYRKKQLIIDAEPVSGLLKSISESGLASWPPWLGARVGRGVEIGDGSILIGTLEGTMRAGPGDMIICGVKGELYPCKPDVFAATYEPVRVDEKLYLYEVTIDFFPSGRDMLTVVASAIDQAIALALAKRAERPGAKVIKAERVRVVDLVGVGGGQ